MPPPPLGVAQGVLAYAYGFAVSDRDPLRITGQQERSAQDFDLVQVVDVLHRLDQLDR